MTLARQTTTNAAGGAGNMNAIHLLLTEGEVRAMGESPEHVMEEIQVRATLVSSVLEEILLTPHGEQWECDE